MSIEKETAPAVDREEVEGFVVELLKEITGDWDIGDLSASTPLGSLGVESINLVYVIAELQERYRLREVLIERLRSGRIDVRRMRIADVAALVTELAGQPAGTSGGGAAP